MPTIPFAKWTRSGMKKNVALFFLLVCAVGTICAYQTRNVFIFVMDGARYTETFGDSVHQYIPRIWNELRPQGTIYTNFFNDAGDALTETCPGHSHILTGTWQVMPNDGSVRPDRPTVFEYFRKATGSPDSSCYVVLGKNKLTMLTYGTFPGYGASYGARYLMPPVAWQYSDSQAWSNVMAVLRTKHPRISIVNMPQVDSYGHAADWAGYLGSIRQADSLTAELWNFFQTDTFYKDSTTLFIVNDHGRHTTDYTSHGDTCYGCRHILCIMLGPDTRAGVVDTALREQIDIAPTIGELLGFATPEAAGTALPLFSPTTSIRNTGCVSGAENTLRVSLNRSTRVATIHYTIGDRGTIILKIIDMQGRDIETLLRAEKQPGAYAIQWDTKRLSCGIYYCRLQMARSSRATIFPLIK
jgi:hypothetical protein